MGRWLQVVIALSTGQSTFKRESDPPRIHSSQIKSDQVRWNYHGDIFLIIIFIIIDKDPSPNPTQ